MGEMSGSTIVVGDSDSDVSQGEWDKMYEGTGKVGMGRGSHTVRGIGDEYIARFKHSYLQAWVLRSFCQIAMDQSSSVMSAKPSIITALLLVSASTAFRISRSSLFQIARNSSCCVSISFPSTMACSQTPNPLKISSVLTPPTKATADDATCLCAAAEGGRSPESAPTGFGRG
jgi:hypothetical protein